MNDETVTDMAAKHIKLMDEANPNAKRFVLDAGHGKAVLAAYQDCNTDIVMRLKSGQVFYHSPGPYPGRGRPAKHAKRFKLSPEVGAPDEQTTISFKGKALRISLWPDLHYAGYSDIEGVVVRLDLDKAGKPLFDKPIWLFSTATGANAETLARA